jgi:hypothetical protein
MGSSLNIQCPYCSSVDIVRNGHPHSAQLEFFCKSCHKYLYENTIKGYPHTSIPFPVIAYLLYFRKKVPGFSNMRSFRRFVNYWLVYLRVSKGEISRQTVHHWIKNFDPLLDKVISFEEASNYCHVLLKDLTKARPPASPIPYGRTLRFLEMKFGKKFLVGLLKDDEFFFKELVNVVGKHGVFCWEFDDKKECCNGLK